MIFWLLGSFMQCCFGYTSIVAVYSSLMCVCVCLCACVFMCAFVGAQRPPWSKWMSREWRDLRTTSNGFRRGWTGRSLCNRYSQFKALVAMLFFLFEMVVIGWQGAPCQPWRSGIHQVPGGAQWSAVESAQRSGEDHWSVPFPIATSYYCIS